MAKFLLVQANYNINNPVQNSAWVPIALIELATLLNENGHEAKVYDRNIEPDDKKLVNCLKNFNPDVVGMTCYTSPMIWDIKRISKITKENSNALVIVGGIHATIEPKSLLDYESIDYVVRGEGEKVILEIAKCIDKNKIKNISKLNNINYNKLNEWINLDELPVPDYSLVNIKKYPVVTFCTSRGCFGFCKFCYNSYLRDEGKAYVRHYNTKKVIEMMTGVLDKYNVKEFTIADDNFASLSPRTFEICKSLEKYNTIFHCFMRVDFTVDKVMEALKRANCWAIQFGFESGSQRMLDFMDKRTTVSQNVKAIEQCKKFDIFVDGSFMLGLPTETVKDMEKTVEFIEKNKLDAIDVKAFKPYPATKFWDYCLKRKLISPPKKLDGWADFCDINKVGDINVSEIPTPILLNTLKRVNKKNYSIYVKKAIKLLFKGHKDYVFYKINRMLFG